ncbi:MAG: tetratricopeptide repeat protein [Pseudomonadota bacterium]
MRLSIIGLVAAAMLTGSGSTGAQTGGPELPASLTEVIEAATAGDLEKALELLKTAADQGNADASLGLAELYRTGTGVEASLSEALPHYEVAANQGNATALLRLGEVFFLGAPGIEKDEDRALFYFQASADAGESRASNVLGQLAEKEANDADALPDRERLFSRARAHFLRGAEGGNTDSQFFYSRLLANGQGGTKDIPKAMEWLHKSALSGNARAMSDLGTRYQEGNGVEADMAAALGWFLAGAERGSLPAMTNLGLCYANGFGVPQNFDRAGSWYSKASKQNYAPAQYLIAQLFENGRGTEKNPVFAYVNYHRAAANGFAAANAPRDALAGKLTPEQLAEGEKILKPPAPSEN